MADQLRERVIAAIGDTYEIEAEIGRGGMAAVYRARDLRLRRLVAIKVLPPDLAFREEVRTRFLREAQTAAQLNHPNIVPIFSVDEAAGLVYFVMALVEGESLGSRLSRERRPAVADVTRVLREVADALGYAHARGIVHRDIKPDNILLDGGTGRAMVTDFGIARAAEGDSRLTVTGIAVGTPTYMSPEQALGERDVDGRSDQYALAVVAYQMLTGEPPFAATNTPAMLLKHISEPPAPLGELRPDLPAALVYPIERALAKKPSERWATTYAFRDALTGEGGTPVPPREASPERLRQSAAWKRPAV
ncbi:MAG: serine/threonine-protein kinase, partial [Gemmatimonadaceae bacterium]